MAANLYNLQNIQPLELNTTGLNDTSTIANTIFATTYNAVGDAWFTFSIFGLFIFFNWLFYRPQENFKFDVSRSLLISSGFCFFISVSVLLGGWIKTVYPLIWFSSLTFIAFILVYNLKQKGQ